MRAQTDFVGAVVSLVVVSIIVLLALMVFDPLAQMGPQSGQLGEANQSLTDAVSMLPLVVGGTGLVVAAIGFLRAKAG